MQQLGVLPDSRFKTIDGCRSQCGLIFRLDIAVEVPIAASHRDFGHAAKPGEYFIVSPVNGSTKSDFAKQQVKYDAIAPTSR